MKTLRYLLLLLLISSESFTQTKLIIYSENDQIFTVNLYNNNIIKEGSTFFEFNNINLQSVGLEIRINNNQKLKKTIKLKNDMQNVYIVSKTNDNYEIKLKGNYPLDEPGDNDILVDDEITPKVETKNTSVANTRTEETEEIDYAKNILINMNKILDNMDTKPNDKSKTLFIVEELNKGNFNCRQMKYLFSKINDDYSKLFTFKSTIRKCIDKENLMILKDCFNSDKYKNDFSELVSSL
jgi:hypothetical protein